MWLMLALYFAYFTNLYWVPVCKARLHSHRHIFSCFKKCSCLLICVGSDFQEVEIELINGQNTAFGLGFRKGNLQNAKLFPFWERRTKKGLKIIFAFCTIYSWKRDQYLQNKFSKMVWALQDICWYIEILFPQISGFRSCWIYLQYCLFIFQIDWDFEIFLRNFQKQLPSVISVFCCWFFKVDKRVTQVVTDLVTGYTH